MSIFVTYVRYFCRRIDRLSYWKGQSTWPKEG